MNGFDHKARVLILVEEFSGWPPSSLSTRSTTNTTHVCPAFRANFRPDTAAWVVLEVKTYDIVKIVRTTRAKHLTSYNKKNQYAICWYYTKKGREFILDINTNVILRKINLIESHVFVKKEGREIKIKLKFSYNCEKIFLLKIFYIDQFFKIISNNNAVHDFHFFQFSFYKYIKSHNAKALSIMLTIKLHASLTRKENVGKRDSRRYDFHFSPISGTQKNQDSGDKSTSELRVTVWCRMGFCNVHYLKESFLKIRG